MTTRMIDEVLSNLTTEDRLILLRIWHGTSDGTGQPKKPGPGSLFFFSGQAGPMEKPEIPIDFDRG